ncbi:MAG: Dam family site-specific DNA-(adenine-N6)-methyltransferase [Acidobacteria bacterium]|nr:Dam family site-specific DNA-(adenine-N6)-methyltransferase [Acidobacteriota bacterium]
MSPALAQATGVARAPARTPNGAGPAAARPFLKWAGGKRQLLPALRPFYPGQFGAYFEPFVGSGAVFFDLHQLGRLDGHRATLADTNLDVVACYEAIQHDVAPVVRHLRALEARHAQDGEACYYDVRDRHFNPLRRRPGALRRHRARLAAMVIYLNRTGFNGLFRLNAAGDFNVPTGRYAHPRICDADNLRAVGHALRRGRVDMRAGSFEFVLDEARPGDFLYFDPPYAPVSPTARFTHYTSGGFGDDDQRRLQATVVELASRGCQVLVSNSVAPIVHDLYVASGTARAAGLEVHRVPARRAINSAAGRRGVVDEFVITNIRPDRLATPAPTGGLHRDGRGEWMPAPLELRR